MKNTTQLPSFSNNNKIFNVDTLEFELIDLEFGNQHLLVDLKIFYTCKNKFTNLDWPSFRKYKEHYGKRNIESL